MVLHLDGHRGAVVSVSFSPSGDKILTASSDRTVRIWDKNSKREISRITISNEVYCASYSPDGKYIVATSYDGKILIFDANTGIEIEELKWQTERYYNHAYTSFFSPNGRMIVTSCADNIIRIWDFSPIQELINQTHDRFRNRQLLIDERRKYYWE